MANVDRPNGARPVMNLNGSPWNGKTTKYYVDASNATAIFPGDFVTIESDGNCAPAAAGGVLLGVCVGIEVDPDNLNRRYLPATTAGYIYVVDDPNVIFEVQEDSNVSNLAETDRGASVDIIAGAGSTTTGQSAHELDSSSVLAASGQLRIYDIVDRPDNAVGTNCKWLVLMNEHYFKQTAGI